jgi:opacity protein-like surface antigen
VTGEYRGKANFHGLQIVNSGGLSTDEYRGSKSEWLVLANIYADLGTWYCLTPFIGAGIGASYNTISNFMDINTPNHGVAFADNASKWNFAWALHAGISYKVNSQLSLEFAYRYVDLGDALSGDIVTYTGTNNIFNPEEFKHITSHDLKFGVRWMLEPPVERSQPIMLPPLMRRG